MSAALMETVVSDDNGNSFDVNVTSRSVLRWEKWTPGRSLSKLQDKFVYVYEVVFIAAAKQLPAGLTFDEFCDGYDIDVKNEDKPADVDPTRPTA